VPAAESIVLLRELTEADGVPGFEDEVRAIFARRLASRGEIVRDRLGGIACRVRGTADRPVVMLDCHMDEIGFLVQQITPRGFIKIVPLGGWSGQVLPAQRVRVWAGGAKIEGVFGSTPPHLLPAERRDKVPEPRELVIDVGASSREQAESWGIRPGAWAAPHSPFTRLRNEKLLLAKALDNRAGCALCIEIVERAWEHPNTLFACASAQEEVGLRGAETAAAMLDPDVAIVLEVPPADDTHGMPADEAQGVLGGGVQIRAYDPTMIANPRLVELAIATAREQRIAHQVAVRTTGGTNAGRIHLNARGVPAIVLGVPARYIHSHASIIHLDDYTAARDLALAMIARLDRAAVEALVPAP
jgi:endoglucanase